MSVGMQTRESFERSRLGARAGTAVAAVGNSISMHIVVWWTTRSTLPEIRHTDVLAKPPAPHADNGFT